MTTFTIEPEGPFSLAAAQDFAGGFAAGIGAHGTATGLLMTYPVEGWRASAAVDVWQTDDGIVHGDVAGSDDVETVRRQAARSLSLDHDGRGWAAIGELDPILGAIQKRYDFLRPVCFYSAYEAATSFVIGQRIAMRQARVVKDRLGAEHGDEIEIGGEVVRPFPRPQQLVDLQEVQGISAAKVARLRDLARAALDGALDTERLRALPEDEALADSSRCPESDRGPPRRSSCAAAASRTRCRSRTRSAGRPSPRSTASPNHPTTWIAMSDAWRPYRMWATVLLHMAWRRDHPTTPSYRQGR